MLSIYIILYIQLFSNFVNFWKTFEIKSKMYPDRGPTNGPLTVWELARGVVWPSESPLRFLVYYRDIGRLNEESVCTRNESNNSTSDNVFI